jgi:CubicO group peptidase (beta-lactamase class C family)
MTRRRFAVVLLTLALVWSTTAGGGQPADKSQAIDAFFATYHDAGLFNGTVLVAENGKVILRKGYGSADFEWQIPNTPDTKFRLGSITKQFTAALILQLVNEGRLTIGTKLADVLPYYRKDTGARITIEHLLTHTSGIPSYTGLPNFMSEVSRNPYEVRAFVEKYCSRDLEFEPGSTFRYNNSGYFILGAIIEQIAGKSYERVLTERIFDPLGMRASGYDTTRTLLPRRARGYTQRLAGVINADYLDMSLPYAAGSLYSTVDDLYIWDRALYTDKVLPASLKEQMFTPRLSNYGFGWMIRKQPIGAAKAERTTIGHGGGINGFSTLITRIPEDQHLVVLLNNTATGGSHGQMTDGAIEILYGRTPSPVRRPIATVLYKTVTQSGVDAAVAQYREISKTRAAEFVMGDAQLIRLGNELAADDRKADAVRIFELAAQEFPQSRAGQLLKELNKR